MPAHLAPDMGGERLDALEKLRELTAGIDVAMLTTIAEGAASTAGR